MLEVKAKIVARDAAATTLATKAAESPEDLQIQAELKKSLDQANKALADASNTVTQLIPALEKVKAKVEAKNQREALRYVSQPGKPSDSKSPVIGQKAMLNILDEVSSVGGA